MVAVTVQGLASLPELQQVEQEGLEHLIQHLLVRLQVARLDMPLMRPVIDIEVLVRKCWI